MGGRDPLVGLAGCDPRIQEIEQFRRAMDALGISSETLHRAYDRYFAETMTDEDEQ